LLTANSRALLALALLVLVWAYSWIIMKQALAHAGPFDFAALRYLGGALVLFMLLVWRRESLLPPPLLPTLTVGLAQTAAFQSLAQWALVSGGAGKVSLFCYTMPFWVVLLAWWWLHEKPGNRQWLGLSLAGTGLLLVISPWQGWGNWISVVLAIGGGIAWAIGTVLSKRVFQRHAISPIRFTAWQMLLGAMALCLVAWQVPSRSIDWSREFLLELGYSVFLASSLAWVLWSFIVRELPTSVAGLSGLLVPVGAITLAWLLLGEIPDNTELVGIIFIIAGLFVIRPRSPDGVKVKAV
jgi:drug/metabolite transporter (DMT)-like permease